jgi:hypothetical protein
MPIGQGVKLIGRAHQGLVSFWGDPWCLGLQRNKTQLLFLPPKPSILSQVIIDIRYHFLRDHQQRGDIEIAYVSTKEQLADIFTKPLDEKTFSKLRNELNILDSRNFD